MSNHEFKIVGKTEFAKVMQKLRKNVKALYWEKRVIGDMDHRCLVAPGGVIVGAIVEDNGLRFVNRGFLESNLLEKDLPVFIEAPRRAD